MNGGASERPSCVYRLTAADVIEFVDEGWGRFAVENGAPTLAEGVVGTSLWGYVSGQKVAHLSRELLAKVRGSGREATIPFRCDSPTVRRFLRMRVVPLAGKRVEFHTWVEREATFSEPVPFLDPAVPRDLDTLLRMCAWCKKLDVEGTWLEIQDAIGRLRLFDHPAVPAITHGICDRCFELVTADSP
jgi:hypothetical protein